MAHLSDAEAPNNILGRAQAFKWDVIEFYSNGEVLETTHTPASLGLDTRDINLFGKAPGESSQRATISQRNMSVLFRNEVVKAVIYADHAILFHCRRERDTIHAAQMLYTNITKEHALPFELRVLDALLTETASQFERKGRRLAFLANNVFAEVSMTLRGGGSELQRVLPIKQALTELQYDVREVREAIAEVVDTPDLLAAICLTEARERSMWVSGVGTLNKRTPAMQLAIALLESYERQIQTIHGALKELEENLNTSREIWAMQLDSTRNRIIRVNLLVTVASFALMISTVPASFFGMNLHSGWEDKGGIFWQVAALCSVSSVITFAGVYGYWRFWPNRRHQRRVRDMTALRDMLQQHHADDLEDVLTALRATPGSLRRKEFAQLIRDRIKYRHISDEEIDLLYRMFDTNRDGFLETGEMQLHLTKAQARQAKAPMPLASGVGSC